MPTEYKKELLHWVETSSMRSALECGQWSSSKFKIIYREITEDCVKVRSGKARPFLNCERHHYRCLIGIHLETDEHKIHNIINLLIFKSPSSLGSIRSTMMRTVMGCRLRKPVLLVVDTNWISRLRILCQNRNVAATHHQPRLK